MQKVAGAAVASAVLVVCTSAALLWGCAPGTGTGGGVGGGFNAPPVPVITSDVVRGIVPLTVTFDSSLSSDDGLIVLREWDFGDGGTSEEIRPRYTFTETGDFVVTLTLTDEDGGTATRSLTISVTEAPVAVIRVDRSSAESAPAVINFDASGSFDPDGEIEEYRWDFGDGSTELLPVVPHTYGASGTFRVRLTVEDDKGISSSAETLISIGIQQPTVEVRIPPPDTTNIVVAQDAPLFLQAVFDVENGVPYTIRAGVDGDADRCNAKGVIAAVNTLTTSTELGGHADLLNDIAYSPDGQFVLTASADATLRLYSASTGDLLTTYADDAEVSSVAWVPGGATFVYGLANGRVKLRERASGLILREYVSHTAAVNDVDVSPDGTQIASAGNDRNLIYWNLGSGAAIRTTLHPLAVTSVAFSRNGGFLATGCADTIIRLFNAADGSLLRTLTGHTEAVNAVAFTNDGLGLVSGSDDNTARLWSALTGASTRTFTGATADVIAVSFSPDQNSVLIGAEDGVARLFDALTGAAVRQLQPCRSPVSGISYAPNGADVALAIASQNDIQLDTDPPQGNDLNISLPQALRLNNVAALNGQSVPPDAYFAWVELDTDRSEPVRAYANPVFNVVEPLPPTIVAGETPVVPLVGDAAQLVVNPDRPRQIIDLGAVNSGDLLRLSFTAAPSFQPLYSPGKPVGLYLLDASQFIYARYQSDYVQLLSEARLTIARGTSNFYVVTEGGYGLNIQFLRNTGLYQPTRQRVFVDFRGAANLSIANLPSQTIPRLNAADFNQFFAVSPNFSDAVDTPILAATILDTMRQRYAGFDVDIVGSNESGPPQPPYKTVYVGGQSPVGNLGIADYLDPRDDTKIGRSIAYALEIGEATIENADLVAPVTSLPGLGIVIGQVASHELGHLLGLRHTDDPADIMVIETLNDPTASATFTAAPLSSFEQLFGLPPIGIQNAPLYLEDVVGLE